MSDTTSPLKGVPHVIECVIRRDFDTALTRFKELPWNAECGQTAETLVTIALAPPVKKKLRPKQVTNVVMAVINHVWVIHHEYETTLELLRLGAEGSTIDDRLKKLHDFCNHFYSELPEIKNDVEGKE